ncbi:MAG: hypothetical protein ABSE49_06115 [Polyangiaceae bacterium]
MTTKLWLRPELLASGVAVAAFVFACSSSSNKNTGGSDGGGGGSSSSGSAFEAGTVEYTAPDGDIAALESPGTCSGTTGGPVLGPQDDHCALPDGGQLIQATTAEGCTDMGDGGNGGPADAACTSGDPCPGDMCAYGAVMYNTWGSDDDCKYNVEWQSTPICENEPVYFTVTVTKREDNSPLLGVETGGTFVPANPRPDVVLSCSHPIPNTPKPRDPSPSVAPGTYVVGPVVFDQPGDWVFRFHFNEECLDIVSYSPHGHAAFHINVP